MQINQHNYEAFFLMYVDNELSLQQQEMVDAFVRQNPKLAKELEMLKQTVSGADETIQFRNKEKLMKSISFTEEDLLTYLNGEADAQMAGKIETSLQHDDALKQQISKLEKLYLSGDDEYVYPRKNDLYKHVPVRRMDWRKMAIAASLLICVSAWLFLYKGEEDVYVPIAKIDTTQQQMEAKPLIKTDSVMPQSSEETVTTPGLLDEPEISVTNVIKKDKGVVQPQNKEVSKNEIEKAETVINRQVVDKIGDEIKPNESINTNNKGVVAKQGIEKIPVAESKTQTAFENAPAKEKKKSFFKKIEKRSVTRHWIYCQTELIRSMLLASLLMLTGDFYRKVFLYQLTNIKFTRKTDTYVTQNFTNRFMCCYDCGCLRTR
ncbi:anti-sigma factor [Niabella ginsengisoli]|uniref:Uncharacterized protein n=1 Tax=Niabella ginsengisoli TaxID=522298 RepID=A0ABS9SQR3_9BACT|nr:hypothetical protein [Niabella ginsengisoli]MCH5600596.1 hypothetical protein [Niabella ginsengisoli]